MDTLSTTLDHRDTHQTDSLPEAASYNMGGQTSNPRGSEDWFEFSVHVAWDANWPNLVEQLSLARTVAQDQKLTKKTGGNMVTLNNITFEMSPRGEGEHNHYQYHLEGGGLVVNLKKSPHPDGSIANVIIRATGLSCLQWGSEACLQRGRELIKSMGGTILAEKLSRVDLCLDLPDVGMDEFVSAYREKRYVTRAKTRKIIESDAISIYWGKRPLMLRVYDKGAEIAAGGRSIKNQGIQSLMIARRWGGRLPERAVRVEFEVRREALTERGINSPEDYFERRADLVKYLCEEWFRFTAKKVDRTNTARASVLPLWDDVKAGFLSWTGQPRGLPLTPLPRAPVDVSLLEKQAVGVHLKAAVLLGRVSTREDFRRYCAAVVDRQMPEEAFVCRTQRVKASLPASLSECVFPTSSDQTAPSE